MKIEQTIFGILGIFAWTLISGQDSSFAQEGTIAFLSNRDGRGKCVYLIEADGSNERLWMERDAGSFSRIAFSSSGKQIAFSIQTDVDVHIFLMDVRTGKRRNLTEPFGAEHLFAAPTWSGDEKWLAFTCLRRIGIVNN